MTLIFGINLCDRIYLSADTRLTKKNNKEEVEEVKDNIMKVVIFSHNIAVAAAGSANMASYLIRKLKKTELMEMNIRDARSRIQEILVPIVEEYWTKNASRGPEDKKVCLIFGGINKLKKKELDAKKVFEEITKYSKSKEGQNSVMTAKPALYNIFVGKKYEEPHDSTVFSIEIAPPLTFKITDTEWGEYLAFGSNGITKDAIEDFMLGKLEFDATSPVNASGEEKMVQDNTLIVAMIHAIAEERKEGAIGNTVTTVFLMGEPLTGYIGGATFIADTTAKVLEAKHMSEIIAIGKTVYRKNKNGTNYKLTSLEDYKDFSGLEMTI